jgi:hypothetical protein
MNNAAGTNNFQLLNSEKHKNPPLTNSKMSHVQGKCSCCQSTTNSMSYMYRNLKGQSVFTGFVQQGTNIIWVGKDEKSQRPILTDEDRQFFMTEMRQYDR